MTTGRALRAYRARALRLAPLAVLALLAAGCQEAGTVSCPTGIYCPAGTRCAARQAACIFDSCGDGDLQAGEACDDGNLFDADGCSSTCKSNETCGNKITDRAVGEECDDGPLNGAGACSTTCKIVTCGNGDVEGTEECDPGKGIYESPGCDHDCTFMRHGDGMVNGAAGELCDGGPPAPAHWNPDCISSTCNRDCTPSWHGDGKVNPLDGEECDGGTGLPGDDCQSTECNADCTWSRHGDRKVNPLDGEDCDGDPGQVTTGMTCQSQACNADCSWSVHGDGVINAMDGEFCDGGGASRGEACLGRGCTTTCQYSICGDGETNRFDGEECDDADGDDNDECLTTCKRATCGDGWVWSVGTTTPEACDEGSRNGVQDCPYGQTSCTWCRNRCTLAAAGTPHYCGNNDIDDITVGHPEACDAQTSFVCGTCIQGCTVDVSPANPAGVITVNVVPGNGEQFTVDDATTTVTFEFFGPTGNCTTAETAVHRCIDVSGLANVNDAAIAVRDEVNAARSMPPGLTVTASRSNNRVDLVNTAAGITGNLPVTGTWTSLTVTGMTGGVGCPVGSPCTPGESDCRVGATCPGGVCVLR